jgi:hypothetical protein
MTLSRREQLYALIAGVMLLIGGGYFYLLSPYLTARAQLISDINAAQKKYDREVSLIESQPKVASSWKKLLAGDLREKPAEAMSRTNDFIYDAARSAMFEIKIFNPDGPKQEGDFKNIRVNVSGVGKMLWLYHFLAAIEQSELPIKIDELRVAARKPGLDDLNVSLTISTLIFAPAPTTRPAARPEGDSL